MLSDSYFEQEGLLVVDLDIDESGIFTFNTTINSEDEFGIIDNLEFENQISVTEITNHIQTIEQIPVEFRVKSYYDSIARFVYNQTDQTAKIIIPFDWKEQNISHTSVVHTEIMFPKDFVSFLAPNYFGTANGIELFKSSIFIDDYSEEESRIVHFVLLKDHLRHIKTQLKNIDDESVDIFIDSCAVTHFKPSGNNGWKEVAENVYRSLKPGGKFIVSSDVDENVDEGEFIKTKNSRVYNWRKTKNKKMEKK